jgi:uncharacterized membrane protein
VNRGIKVKWAMIIMLIMTNILITAGLVYSIFKSQVMISGNDPFILNMAMIFAVVGVALWIVTFFMISEVVSDSSMNRRLIIIEKILMEKGINNRK